VDAKTGTELLYAVAKQQQTTCQ